MNISIEEIKQKVIENFPDADQIRFRTGITENDQIYDDIKFSSKKPFPDTTILFPNSYCFELVQIEYAHLGEYTVTYRKMRQLPYFPPPK